MKVLCHGATAGEFASLREKVAGTLSKHGQFDCLILCGTVFSASSTTTDIPDFPLPVFFTLGVDEPATAIQSVLGDDVHSPREIKPNFTYLGSCGQRVCHFGKSKLNISFVSNKCTLPSERVVQLITEHSREIDVLVTPWPTGWDKATQWCLSGDAFSALQTLEAKSMERRPLGLGWINSVLHPPSTSSAFSSPSPLIRYHFCSTTDVTDLDIELSINMQSPPLQIDAPFPYRFYSLSPIACDSIKPSQPSLTYKSMVALSIGSSAPVANIQPFALRSPWVIQTQAQSSDLPRIKRQRLDEPPNAIAFVAAGTIANPSSTSASVSTSSDIPQHLPHPSTLAALLPPPQSTFQRYDTSQASQTNRRAPPSGYLCKKVCVFAVFALALSLSSFTDNAWISSANSPVITSKTVLHFNHPVHHRNHRVAGSVSLHLTQISISLSLAPSTSIWRSRRTRSISMDYLSPQ